MTNADLHPDIVVDENGRVTVTYRELTDAERAFFDDCARLRARGYLRRQWGDNRANLVLICLIVMQFVWLVGMAVTSP